MTKETEESKETKKIIIWFIILTFPILFSLLVAGIKETIKPKENITKITYVHIFYVPNTQDYKLAKDLIEENNLKCQIVYHDISKEGQLYYEVLNYFKMPIEIINPLVVVNNELIKEDNSNLIDIINKSIEIYSKEDLSSEDIAMYNIVDRISARKEIENEN